MDELFQEEEGKPSQWELSQKLSPTSQMSREAAAEERASINYAGEDHPFWKIDHPAHKDLVKRMQGLIRRMEPSKEEKAAATARQREELDKQVAGYWEKYDRERAKEELQKIRDKLREQLAREGKSADIVEEADQILDGALESIEELKGQGILAKDFPKFLDETLEGSSIENIRGFHWVKTLNEKYREWAEKKAKGR